MAGKEKITVLILFVLCCVVLSAQNGPSAVSQTKLLSPSGNLAQINERGELAVATPGRIDSNNNLFRVTEGNAAATNINWTFDWYEHTNKN